MDASDAARPSLPAPEGTDRPKVLVLVPFGWSVRNYVLGTFLEHLGKRCRIAVALRHADEDLLSLLRDRVDEIVELPQTRRPPLAHALDVLLIRAHESRRRTHTVRVRRSLAWKNGGLRRWAVTILLDAAGWLVGRLAWEATQRLLRRTTRRYLTGSGADRLVRESQPSAILATAPFSGEEAPVVHVGVAAQIPTAAAVLSWDNLSSKSRMPVTYDRYFVWSEAMARDLATYYPEVPASAVSLTGTPQFDFVTSEGSVPGRADFFASMGLDASRPLITYTASTAQLLPDEEWIVEKIAQDIQAGRLYGDPQLLVRLHPLDDGTRFAALREAKVPVVAAWRRDVRDRQWGYPKRSDLERFLATLRHTAVNVNFCSTMTLDFATVDRPVVNVALQTPACVARGIDASSFYRYEHYQPVLETGAARIVRTPEELHQALDAYLRDPSLDRESRRRLVDRICGPLDGGAGGRIAAELAEMARAFHDRRLDRNRSA